MDQNQPLFALIQQLQQQLVNQQQQLEALAPTRPQFRLPDPPRFDGRPFSLKTWLPAIQAKLRSDDLVGQPAFDYVYDRLEPPQQASVLHLRETDPTPEAVFRYFERLCHNPREKQDAVLRFANIRQKDDESLVAYLARFERLSHEARVHQQDLLRTITLHRGLRLALRQTLEQSYDTLFDLEYDEYVELLQRYDRRQQRPVTQNQTSQYQTNQNQTRQNQTSQYQTRQNQTSQNQTSQNQTSQTRSDLMDLDPINVRTTQIRPVKPASSAPEAPKDPARFLKDRIKAATPDDSQDREYRRSLRSFLGQCYYCGSLDHWISDCPASRSRSRSRSSTASRRPTPQDAYSSDDDP